MRPWIILSLALTVAAAASSGLVWTNREAWLPERVPTHWNAAGQPDAFLPRDGMLGHLMLTPALLLGWLLLGLALPWLSPAKFKVEPFRPTYEYIMGLVCVMFAWMHGVTLGAYTQQITDITRWLVGGSLLAIALLGNVLGKVQRNFWIGIRTPWTLASDTVWIRTHRLGAWLFTGGGVLGFILVMCGVNALVALGIFGVAALVPIVYSLILYKRLEREGKLDLDPPASPAAVSGGKGQS